MRRRFALVGATLAAAALAAAPAGAALEAAPTSGADGPRVSVTSPLGSERASLEGSTTLEVSGTDYQVVQGGFGGIYVAFGWVSPETWRPSEGGQSGEDFVYVPDAMTAADNTGAMAFLAFPGSSTAEESTGVMNDDGTWATTITVAGPVVELSDLAGNAREVDCRVEQCGIFTFGAHGVKNANNEVFVPVTFVEPGAATQGEGTGAGATPDGAATVGRDAAGSESDAPAEGAAVTEGEGEGTGEGEDAAGAADEPGDGATVVLTAEPQRSWWPWVIVGGVAVVGAGVVWGAVATSRRRPPST